MKMIRHYHDYNETSLLLSATELQKLVGRLVMVKLTPSTQFPTADPADANVAPGSRPSYPTYQAADYAFFE